MRLLLDEMLDREIAVQLRDHGHDVQAVQEMAALRGISDDALLRAAVAAEAVLVTDNVADSTRLHKRFRADGDHHCGILLASPARFPRSKRTIGLWVQALATFLGEAGAGGSLHDDCSWLVRVD